jgi:O-antigen/teichoic acid export membrane protein
MSDLGEDLEENKTSLTSQSAWLLFAKTIGFALSFVLPVMVFRTLSKAEIGIYNQVFLVIVTVSGILPFGVSMSAYYFLSREKERKPFYIFNILLFNFVVGGLACLFLGLYPQILQIIFKDPEMSHFAPQIGVVIWLWVFSSFFETVAIANQEARLATAFIISGQLSKAVFMISAVYFYGTVGAMLNAATIQAVLETIALFVYLNSRFKGFWNSFDKELFAGHLKYALPFGLAGILWILQTEAHNYFIGYRFSPEEVAIYRAGCFQLPLLVLLYESISSVMIPRMSQLQSEGKNREMIQLTIRAMEKIALVYFPTYIFFFITAYTLITTLFTKNFADSIPIFLINITLLPFYVFIGDPIVRAYESLARFILRIRILIIILLLLTLYFGIQYLDLSGMITIVVITSLFDRFCSLGKIWKTVGAQTSDIHLLKNVGKTAIAAILAGIPTYFVYNYVKLYTPDIAREISVLFFDTLKQSWVEVISGGIALGLTALIFVPVYLFFINYLGVVSDEEKGFFLSKVELVKRKFGNSRQVTSEK